MLTAPHQAFRVKELAARWRKRPQYIRGLIRAGKLPAFDLDGQLRISAEAVLRAEGETMAVWPVKRKRAERIAPEVLKMLEV